LHPFKGNHHEKIQIVRGYSIFITGVVVSAVARAGPGRHRQDSRECHRCHGALISGATVVVTNIGTKISKQTTTNSQGFYQVL
jgi:hypothetical protein